MLSKYIKNARGYTLLITVVIIILFSIVGLSLMSLSINGSTKNNSREATSQSLNLSEKGLDYLTNEINTTLTNFVKDGISKDDYLDLIEQYNENNPKYKCTFNEKGELVDGLKIKTNNSEDVSIACIKAVHPADDGNELKRILEIVSVGIVNGKLQQITAFQEIGPDKVPEQLKYALTSPGNVHLDGAVQITGDLRFGGHLTTFNRAHATTTKNYVTTYYWPESLKPSIKSTSKRSNPRIVVSNNSKFYSVTNNKDTDNKLYSNIHKLDSSVLSEKSKTDIDSLFDLSVFDKKPSVVTSDAVIKPVDISGKKSSYYYASNTATALRTIKNSYRINPSQYTGKRYLQYYYSCGILGLSNCYKDATTSSTFNISNGTYEFDKLATSANLSITSDNNNTTKVKIKDTLYVEGNLTIKGNVELEGSIYVKGQLIIGGEINKTTILKSNSLIYVEYDSNDKNAVDIQYSTINSLPYTNSEGIKKNGTLVIFSKGSIKLANNSIYSAHDKPSEIFGYLYSDKALEIFGTGSNIKINGGIYGNKITLHGIRGNANDKQFTGSKNYGPYYFMTRATQDDFSTYNANELENDSRCNYPDVNNKKNCFKYHSRLQVHYNEDIISTFLDLDRQDKEELIYDVSPPRLIDKQY